MTRGRTPSTVPMLLTLEPRGAPRHQPIYAALRAAILNGTLRQGDRLPSTRIVARDLGVSRTTVLGASSRLLTEGYGTGNAGAGTRVAALPLSGRRRDAPSASASADDAMPLLSSAARALVTEGKWRNPPRRATP